MDETMPDILIADDQLNWRKNLSVSLYEYGRYHCDLAHDYEEAQKKISQNSYKLILLNREFRTQSESRQVLRFLKGEKRDIPVIIISANIPHVWSEIAENSLLTNYQSRYPFVKNIITKGEPKNRKYFDELISEIDKWIDDSPWPIILPERLKNKIDFGIINIREDEFRAVIKRFRPDKHFEENRHYAITRISAINNKEYNVAIVRAPEQGTGEAQDVARDMIEDLNPRWLMLVGIAGGVPAYEYTLGDVVVANRLHDFSVEAVVEGSVAEYSVGGGPMHKAVQDILANLPAFEEKILNWNSDDSIGVPRPPVQLVPDNFYGNSEWRQDVKKKLSRHFGRAVLRRRPLYTSGAIVSSDRLVKSTGLLSEWRKVARHVVAVEMELAGVYHAARRKNREYPILAIRGISDIVGFKRHPDWTEYACNSAAAFAYSFVNAGLIEPISS